MQPGAAYALEVNPRLPQELARLNELAGNLWYSWNRQARELFSRMHPQLWDIVGHNPTMFLRSIDERCLRQAANDPDFLERYRGVLAAYDSYHADTTLRQE